MKNEKSQVDTAGTSADKRRRQNVQLIYFFLAVISIGFFLNLAAYYVILNKSEIRLAITRLHHKFHQTRIWLSNTHYTKPYLIDLDFTWLKNNENICKREFMPFNNPAMKIMPVLVHTARSHFEERQAIRKTWGSLAEYKNWTIRVVFLLGEADRVLNPFEINQTKFEKQEEQLEREQNEHGDLVMGSFVDSYKNLTYKHLMGYKWILNFCRNADFVIKVDDDIFIDTMRFIDWRNNDDMLQKQNTSINATELYCQVLAGSRPFRVNGTKWFVTKEEWPEDIYPNYCNGWAYGITVNLLERIYSVSYNKKFLYIDDLQVTGVFIEELKKIYHYEPVIRNIQRDVQSFKNIYRQACEMGQISRPRVFETVVPILRGNSFKTDMICLWIKTLYDSKHVTTHVM